MRKAIGLCGGAVALLWLAACSSSSEFRLKGEGVGDTPLLVVKDDPVSGVDTIVPERGKFTYALRPDTLHLLRLLTDSGEVVPVFADRAWRVEVRKTPGRWTVKGDGPNKEYGQFLESVQGLDEAEAAAQAERFVREHPGSYVSAYLIDRYFVQVPSPDREKIRQLVEPLEGNIKDCRVLEPVLKALAAKPNDSQYLTYFSVKDRKGNYLSWTGKADYSLTLVQLWATWNPESVERRAELYRLLKEFRPDEFRVVNLSLDYSEQDWLRSCRKDTLQWVELCDRKAWDNALVKQLDVRQLPANVLVDKSRKILARDVYGDELKEKALRLLEDAKGKAQEKAKEKARKSRR